MINLLIMVLTLVFLGILFVEIDNKEKEDRRPKVSRVVEADVVPFVSDRKSMDGWYIELEEEDPVVDYKEYYREVFREEFKRRRIEWEESLLEESPPRQHEEDRLFSF